MELERFIAKRISKNTDFGWICSADGDTLDVLVPDGEDIDEAVEDLKMIVTHFLEEYTAEKRAIKYLIWNSKKEERSGITDPDDDGGGSSWGR
ncbi:MAG: hypothetical protein EOO88_16025 [Pedobacter sp.]|nr:MAG: hypothetical protein EOO88_16025 [Pedobacter sp.]